MNVREAAILFAESQMNSSMAMGLILKKLEEVGEENRELKDRLAELEKAGKIEVPKKP